MLSIYGRQSSRKKLEKRVGVGEWWGRFLFSWRKELELESGGGDFFLVGEKSWSWRVVGEIFFSWSQELERDVYFFINVVSIRLISAAKVSTSSIDTIYPSSFAISSCVIVSYSEPRAIDRK